MAGICIYRTGIAPDWIDYNGHLRDAYFGLIVSFAIDALMDRIGLDAVHRQRSGCTLYTLELHVHYLREIRSSALVEAQLRILGADRKRIHAAFELYSEPDSEPAAVAEAMLLHVRQGPPAASEPFAPATVAAIAELRQAGATLPASPHGSRRIQLPPPR